MTLIHLRDAAARHKRRLRELGDEIRRMREDAGLSQRALAKAAGIGQPHLSQIEAGSAEPTLAVLGRLGAALGADLSVRYFANTGSRVRDRLQLAIEEALLQIAHARYRRSVEVHVWRPVRGVIDVVLHDRTQPVSVATEVHSQIWRVEQQIRWANEKADALAAVPEMAGRRVARLIVLRNTVANRELVRRHAAVFAAGYPGEAIEAYGALTTETGNFRAPTLLWATIEEGQARILPTPPRGVGIGR